MASNIKLRQNSLLLSVLLLTSDTTTDEQKLSDILDRDEGEWIPQIGTRAYATGLGCIEITPESTYLWEHIAEKLGFEQKDLPNLQDHLQYMLKNFDRMSTPNHRQTRYGPQGRKFDKMSWKQNVLFICNTFGVGISSTVQDALWTKYDPEALCKYLNRSPLFSEKVDVEWTKAAVASLKEFFENCL
ncbi:hypothetical protein EG328_004148 [Venturia inaequalis]|uniref:Uncharacterized protein n=1 Tax=Venturia inaequalis TaxID=5025 RepID=A0A8H3VEI0_VENIN|nr:hypothetical protein EG328_004148 [Venturia inaequalis]